jgi:hypothetical protein
MQFLKKVVVLKQIESGFSIENKAVSGIVRLELFDGACDLFLTTINFSSVGGGEYSLFLLDSDKKLFRFDLGFRPSSFKHSFISPPNLTHGFAVGICLIKNDLPVTVAFARDLEFVGCLTDFKKAVAENILEKLKQTQKPQPSKPTDTPKTQTIKDLPTENQPQDAHPLNDKPLSEFLIGDAVYDDDAVATENYYSFDKELDAKLNAIKEWEDGRLRIENELPYSHGKNEEKESKANDNRVKDETTANGGKGDKQKPYYQTVKKDLEKILESGEEELGLQSVIPFSRFVKVAHSENKYYAVGLIKKDGKEKYICYGVPSTYSPTPPKQLAGYCTFIPISVFDLKGAGYWMMFQDAVTGECVHPK